MITDKEHKTNEIQKTQQKEGRNTADVNDSLIFNLRNLSHTMRFLYEGKGSQKRILIILSETGKITQKDLTEYLGIRPGSASEVISKLEAAGYIVRSMSESDRRTMNIELSEEGKKAAAEAINQRKQRHKEMFSCLSEEDKAALLSLLETVNADWERRYHDDEHHGRKHHHEGRHHENEHFHERRRHDENHMHDEHHHNGKHMHDEHHHSGKHLHDEHREKPN